MKFQFRKYQLLSCIKRINSKRNDSQTSFSSLPEYKKNNDFVLFITVCVVMERSKQSHYKTYLFSNNNDVRVDWEGYWNSARGHCLYGNLILLLFSQFPILKTHIFIYFPISTVRWIDFARWLSGIHLSQYAIREYKCLD